MGNDKTAKMIYMYGNSFGIWNGWINSVNGCWEKRGLDVGKARGMLYDRNERQGFVREECLGDEP